MGKEHQEQKIEKWKQGREVEKKLLIGLGFKLNFVPIFHFPVPYAHSSF